MSSRRFLRVQLRRTARPVSRRGNSRRQRPNGLNRGLPLPLHPRRAVGRIVLDGRRFGEKTPTLPGLFQSTKCALGLGRRPPAPRGPADAIKLLLIPVAAALSRPLPDADCRVISGIRQGQAANTDLNSLGWMSGGRYGQPPEKASERAAFGGGGKLWAKTLMAKCAK